MPNYSCHKHDLHLFTVHYLIKASGEIAASSLKDFLSKLCIIMLINPYMYNFLEKNIFDLQIIIDRLHPRLTLARENILAECTPPGGGLNKTF